MSHERAEAASPADRMEDQIDYLLTMSANDGTVPAEELARARRLYREDTGFQAIADRKIAHFESFLGRPDDAKRLRDLLQAA